MPDLQTDMMAYFHALNAMCDRMLPGFAVALGVPADYFAPFFANEGACQFALPALPAAGPG